jgi:hypothetical protein
MRRRLMAVLAAMIWLSSFSTSAVAQVQGYPVETEPPAAPSLGRAMIRPPVVVQLSPSDVPGFEPICGCPLQPECPPPVPSCRDPFRWEFPNGAALTAFPQQLFWEPPLASPHEPRMLFMPTSLSNQFTEKTLDTTIGGIVGLFRLNPASCNVAYQLDMFALVSSRIAQYDYMGPQDYRAGLPITFAYGPWHGKFGYEHTSTHLGDETVQRTGRRPIDYIKDELVFGLGRWCFDNRLRLYSQTGWAFAMDVPGTNSPFRFDLGAEWYKRRATGFRGQPFAATNVEFNGAVNYQPSVALQLGWQWRNPERRLSQSRVFVQYYTGYSPYGQFFDTREQWLGLGIAFDY